jgi:hypothetical protein
VFEKIASEGIVRCTRALKRFGMTEQLGNQVKVSNRLEKFANFPKLRIRIDLFQVSLREALLVVKVRAIRAFRQSLSVAPDVFTLDVRKPVSAWLLGNCDFIAPLGNACLAREFDVDTNVWVFARRQAPDLRQPSPFSNSSLQPTAWLRDVSQKANGIQEVRFA